MLDMMPAANVAFTYMSSRALVNDTTSIPATTTSSNVGEGVVESMDMKWVSWYPFIVNTMSDDNGCVVAIFVGRGVAW